MRLNPLRQRMLRPMKPAIAILIIFFGQPVLAAGLDPWLSKMFPEASDAQSATLLPESSFFEVPVSKLAVAELRLAEQPAVAQEAYAAQYYGRAEFSCQASESLYLLRAVYTNGGTGAFQVQLLAAGSVWVSHHSLGRSSGTHRSALLACLPKQPARVFVSSSGAM